MYPEEVISQFKACLNKKEREREKQKEKEKEKEKDKEKDKEKEAQLANGQFVLFTLYPEVVMLIKSKSVNNFLKF